MKRIKKLLLTFLLIMLVGITYNVKADGFNYYLSNSDLNYNFVEKDNQKIVSVQRGDYLYVTTVIDNNSDNLNYQLGKGKLTIRWDKNHLELVKYDNGEYYSLANSDYSNIQVNSITLSNSSDKLTIQEYSSSEIVKTGKSKLFDFKFHVLDNAKAGNTRIYQMDGEDTINCYNPVEEKSVSCAESLLSELKYNVEKSNINSLSNIKINGAELEYFDENILEYNLEVDGEEETVEIEAIKKDSLSGISEGYGKQKLSYGLNTFKITVTSEAGTTRVYTINIIRTDNRSSDNTLKSITLSSGEIEFNSYQTEYTVNVSNEVNHIKVNSELNDSKARYVTGFGNTELDLIEGSNKVLIKVINEKNEENVYTITINRALSSNNSLKTLKVNDEKIELLENEFTYSLNFGNDIEEVVILATPNDASAKVLLNEKYPLVVGENEISIIVEAPSGDKATYIINITRDAILSSDSALKKLEIEGYNLQFKRNVTYYTLKIKNEETKLNIITETEDPKAEVIIEGNDDLINGSIIKVNVKAENGTYTRYFINIEKTGKNHLLPIIITIIVLMVLLGACAIVLFIRKKKENEKREFKDLDKPTEKNEEIQEEMSSEDEKKI